STPRAMLKDTLDGADARASVRAPDREIAPELEAICVRATSLDREARFASAREMHDAIEKYLDGKLDRDRRREMADEHMRLAELAAKRADSSATTSWRSMKRPDENKAKSVAESREEALRQASSALALDPS